MSKPRYGWWGYMKYVLRQYPTHKRKLAELQSMRMTQSYDGGNHSGGITRAAESSALRQLPADEQREFDAVERVIKTTAQYEDGEERTRLLDMVFFKQSHSLTGAAVKLNVSYSTAKRWHNRAIVQTAIEMGLHHASGKGGLNAKR